MGCTVAKTLPPNVTEGGKLAGATRHAGDGTENGSAGDQHASKKPHHPACPVSERQLYSLKKSWKAIGRNMSETGVNMFVRLFETNEDVQELFVSFKELKYSSQLRSSHTLENHAMMVMCTIDEAITNLDDIEYTTDMLQKVGKTHQRFPTFKPELFWKIEEPFLLAVKETLGDRYTMGMEFTYKRTIKYILDNLVEGLKMAK